MVKSTAPMLGFYLVFFCLEASGTPESVVNLDQYGEGEEAAKGKITVYYPNSESRDILVQDLRDIQVEPSDEEDLDKRGDKWTSLHSGWGKRVKGAVGWNQLAPGWGKRPDNRWNKLTPMWGKKRQEKEGRWNNLSGMWGKRSQDGLDDDGRQLEIYSSKRAWTSLGSGWGKRERDIKPHWNRLRGLWGKREAPSQVSSASSSSTLPYLPSASPM